MKSFTTHTGTVVPLDRSDVDTDQLVPKQFLKRVERTGFGQFLFFDWRYQPDGTTPNADFVLNQPQYKDANILLSRRNFGCGSSREHAPWALCDYGFRAILASSFADIFYNNSFKNGLLLIQLPEATIDDLFKRAAKSPLSLTIDLEKLQITGDGGISISFELDPFRQKCLLRGLDDIALTLEHEDAIAEYEAKHGIY